MTPLPDHYSALGIDPTADQEVITAAYRALAKKFHPDTGATNGTASPERFDQVQQAYEVLRTPESRHAYDLELLEQTERELAEHLATRSRIVPKGDAPGAASPPPDLGTFRPASPPGAPYSAVAARKPRSILPFLVPVLLLLVIGGGALALFMPKSPEAPALPGTPPAQVTAAAPPAEAPVTAQETPAAPKQDAPAPQEMPVFGSTVTDAAGQVPDDPPLFGSTATEEAPPAAPLPVPEPDASPEPPPIPKVRPVHATVQPPRAASAPRPAPQPAPQPQRVAADGPYRLVIFERVPGQDATAWRAGVVFDSEGSCTEFGVKSVLRRLANRDPENADAKVWYECQLSSDTP